MPELGLNAAFSLATNLAGVRADPYRAFNFLVEIEGILAGGFSECTGLQVETETYEYREGGLNAYAHRFAGPTRYPPLLLRHGLTAIDGLWGWHQDVVEGRIERRNGTIYLLDSQRIPVIWWDFREAFPFRWSGPSLVASSSQVAVESVEIVHCGLSRPRLATALAGIGAAIGGSLSISGGIF
ncbi:phage tail protein [Accumulibacter sp.]|uniref:phage tail protein n=1 Tax=Accumulibacter sp. TaxID=2053492 RepID=UPI0025ED8E18|nr:phage tail protein [Accumulibacter sp.]MCM8596512.1 phage tail protein [Accumulibacter sp.]MCM8627316.1 phage tail protein [Accumulibacter sp.]MDS4050661.1 phage tail protein [Accumulibacter sp.]